MSAAPPPLPFRAPKVRGHQLAIGFAVIVAVFVLLLGWRTQNWYQSQKEFRASSLAQQWKTHRAEFDRLAEVMQANTEVDFVYQDGDTNLEDKPFAVGSLEEMKKLLTSTNSECVMSQSDSNDDLLFVRAGENNARLSFSEVGWRFFPNALFKDGELVEHLPVISRGQGQTYYQRLSDDWYIYAEE